MNAYMCVKNVFTVIRQRILPDPLRDYANLKLFASVYIAEILLLLPKIPLLPRLN